jgi:putative hemolysin
VSTDIPEPPLRTKPSKRAKKQNISWLTFLVTIALLWFGTNLIWAQGNAPEGTSNGEIPWGRLILVVALILVKAFFSISETSLVSLRRSRVRQLIEEDRRNSKRLERLLSNPPRYLATIQIGVEFASAFASVEAATQFAHPFTLWAMPIYNLLHISKPEPYSVVIITLIAIFFLITFGEVVPKSLGMQHPEIWSLRVAPFMDFLARLMHPLVVLVTGVSNLVVRRFGGHAHFAAPVISEEELKVIVETSEEHGVLEEEETEIIKSVFEFTDTIAREVMTPRTDIKAVDITESTKDVVSLIAETGFSRIPVFEETIDQVVGIVYAKDVLAKLNGSLTLFTIKEVMRPVYFIPENKSVVALLREMRVNRNHIAVVRDEYGGTAGLVTIEDLVEELVGDIMDEYDEEQQMFQTVCENVYIVDGRMHLDEINERLGLRLDSEEFDTIGGFVFGYLGHQPEAGESIQYEGPRFTVTQTDGRRIEKVKIECHPEPNEPEETKE